MCGIAGVIGPHPAPRHRIDAALRALGRRGPDAAGDYAGRLGDFHVQLLHTRLAIIDLDPRSNQPFVRDGLALAFNGEIYNYLEVRQDLEARGIRFSTHSDTEVLLEAWRTWGEACLDRLEGMWTFAILDVRAGHVVLCRDRFGEKPLFISQVGDSFYFASEIKALAALSGVKPEVNTDHIRRYLAMGYKVLHKGASTYFRNVTELPAASLMTLNGPHPGKTSRYWELSYRPAAMSAEEALDGARTRLFDAVSLRLRADVPIAFCLSGGVDSTALASIAAKRFGQELHCFSVIDQDERYDETDNINAVVADIGCRHDTVRTSTDGFFDRMSDLVAYHDAPVATISYYVHAFLSEAIAAHGYKVAIAGTAADELYTGYYDHYPMWLAEMAARAQNDPSVPMDILIGDWRNGPGRYVRNPLLQDPYAFVKNPDQREHILLDMDLFKSYLAEPFDEAWTEEPLGGSLLRGRMLNELFHEVTPVILDEDDRNSMRYSIENRSPFLDRRLAEFLYTVPSQYLIKDGFQKWILRESCEGIITDTVRLDKRKRGFNASIDSMVDRSLPETRERLLDDGPIFDIVRRDAIEDFLNGSMKSNSFSKFLFSFISSKLFLEHHQTWDPAAS